MLLLALLSLLLFPFLVSSDSCPSGFTLHNSKCLSLITNLANYGNALSDCSTRGGSLVSIHNAIDNRAFIEFANSSSTPFWIGLKCSGTQQPASCLWDDQTGNAGSYNSFAAGYPVSDIGKCVYAPTSGYFKGQWLSGDCTTTSLNYICETSPIPVKDSCTLQSNGYCYLKYLSPLSEPEAQNRCQQECGNLVSIHSREENDFVQSFFTNIFPPFLRIGAIKKNTQNSWIDGSNWDYTNIGQDNSNLGACWSMALSNDTVPAGTWISDDCNTLIPYACKRELGAQCMNQCTGTQFLDNSGTINSPNWPNSYLGEQNPCRYLIDTPVGTIAQIQFLVINLDDHATIDLYYRLEDRTPFVTLMGSRSNGWYNSTTNTLRVVFNPCVSNCPTDGLVYKWQANFKSSDQVVTRPPRVTVTPDPYNPSGCNATFLPAPGQISSPNYPNPYPIYADCMYNLSTDKGYRIKINFGQIDTKEGTDYIVIRDGPYISSDKIDSISGNWPVHSKQYQSTSNSMLVSFTSDGYNPQTGFIAYFDSF